MKVSIRWILPCVAGAVLFATLCTVPLYALGAGAYSAGAGNAGAGAPANEAVSTTAALTDMEARAGQAEPRERCFLYTELLQEWTEFAGRSLAAGDTAAAATAIQHADANALRLKGTINRDSKRLKNAELLMGRSVHRLSDILRASTLEERDSLRVVLRHLSDVHDDLLAAVFAH